ncbi:MAG: hypothetical protein ABSA46_15445 [Thermodesulfovibrionales bacterium]|jgi:hypothetical protein
MKIKLPNIKLKRTVPDYLKDRDNLTKKEFAKKYFGDDKLLETIAIEFKEHLEKMYNLDLSGLHPDDRLCDVIGAPIEKDEILDGYDTVASRVKKTLNLYIDCKPFEKYLKYSKWDKTAIRYRSFGSLVREIAKYKK